MIKIIIQTTDGEASRTRKDGQVVTCFVDVCRALGATDNEIEEGFKTIFKEKTTKENGKTN